MTKKKRKKEPIIEKAEASTFSKILFVLIVLLFLTAVSYWAITTGHYPKARLYPGQPWWVD